MKKLSLTFVEDEHKEIAFIEDTLQTTGYFNIRVLASYDAIKAEHFSDTDLFVLDVFTANDDENFCKFISELHMRKLPFIAFSRLSSHYKLRALSGTELRQAIHERGGLGLVSKTPNKGDDSHMLKRDMQMDLVEKILTFYWAHRGLSQTAR